MRALITKFIKWLESLIDEGKPDMTELLATAEADAAKLAAAASVEGVKILTATESDIALLVAKAVPLVETNVSVVAADIDKFAATLKILMDKSSQSAPAYDKIVAFAKALLLTADVDALAAKLQELIPVSGQKLTAWDEMVALAKALTAAA